MAEADRRQRLLAEFAAGHAAVLKTVRIKWPSFVDRVHKEGVTVAYDPQEDILFFYPGTAPSPASTEDLAENVYVRLALDTEDVVGLEVLDFQRNISGMKLASAAFGDLLPALMTQRELTFSPETRESAMRAKRLQQLFRSVG